MGAFEKYSRGVQLGMGQGQNALAQAQFIEKQDRKRKLQNILSGAYTQPVEASPAVGLVQPAVEAQPGGMDIDNAINAMYQGGFGPEAMELEMKRSKLAGATPSAVNEYNFWKTLPAKQQEQFLNVKRARQMVDIGAGYVSPTLADPTITEPVATRQLKPTETQQYIAEAERTKKLSSAAATQSAKAFDESQKIGRNITNLEEVVNLVDKEGASTGPLMSRLPSFREASIKLDNMQKQLGLDVIGAVTFGALSKGELDLAMSKALPTSLKGPALIKWARDKITAQTKLKSYLEEQAIYLSKPGSSAAGWIEMQKGKAPVDQTESPKTGAIQGGYVFMGGDPADPNSWKKQ